MTLLLQQVLRRPLVAQPRCGQPLVVAQPLLAVRTQNPETAPLTNATTIARAATAAVPRPLCPGGRRRSKKNTRSRLLGPLAPLLAAVDPSLLHPAMLPAVKIINYQPDRQPTDQPNPIPHSQVVHHVAIHHDSGDRNYRHPRRSERPWLRRIRTPQHNNRYAHDHEREQRPDIHHLSDIVDRRHASHDCRQQPHQNGVLVRRPILRMYRRWPSSTAPASAPAASPTSRWSVRPELRK